MQEERRGGKRKRGKRKGEEVRGKKRREDERREEERRGGKNQTETINFSMDACATLQYISPITHSLPVS